MSLFRHKETVYFRAVCGISIVPRPVNNAQDPFVTPCNCDVTVACMMLPIATSHAEAL
jgi:hypothetical protein